MRGKIKALEEVVDIERAKMMGLMSAITSGVAKSPEDEIERVVEVVRALKRYNVPIGVVVYPTSDSTRLKMLRSSR